ncbi:MAG: NUDIX domain-containing protein [Anaerolineales bacterium]|jgi:ADP-ribose pyrophosphatase YjhB (NUDIX family)
MEILQHKTNPFDGVVVDPQELPTDSDSFRQRLQHSLNVWTQNGNKVVWLEISLEKAALVPVAAQAGFKFHHSGETYVMMIRRLVAGAFIPPYATHYVGAGGVVLDDQDRLLVVWEKLHRKNRPYYYKLPGGGLKPGEHLVKGVKREVLEETGVQAEFESLICLRHWHGYRYGKSDIYFVCRLRPLNHAIIRPETEIHEVLWMPVAEYLVNPYVGIFNKMIVQAAHEKCPVMVVGSVEDYDPAEREVFFPG